MKAMILAAGIGSRLRPLTDATPKALVEVGGVPMLEHVVRRLEAAGVDDVIVNVHHHATQVANFARRRGGRARVTLSREDDLLLDTGGGLKKAADFFADDKPFLVHNVDVVSGLDLRALLTAHERGRPLVTLAVQDRPSKRRLAFTPEGRLLGRAAEGAQPAGTRALAYSCVHAASPRLFEALTETGVFSLTDAYARLADAGEDLRAFEWDGYWTDIGDAAKLQAARLRAAERGLPA